jgi:multisubunit Na+/H+ antiporter MnhG subunit
MSDSDKLGLFLVIVGLGLVASKASSRLAQEVGVPALVITVFAGIVGHGIARELPG